jgi:enoyl-CoA hydratase/carnithine racemase
MDEPSVIYERRGEVGWVILNHPDDMNPISEAMLIDLFDVTREATADKSTRVLVVGATGPHFSAGGDLSWEGELDEASSLRLMRLTGHLSYELRNSPKPMIGAIRGYCLGGGNELNLHLDVSIASETAQFSQPETRWGVLPFWYTPQLLPLVIGERRAREVILFGRMYDADQALEIGLCNAVVPDEQLEDEAQAWAEELLDRSPTALRLSKMSLNSASDALRAAANHDAAIVTLTAGSERYQQEVGKFFDAGVHRRPRPAPPRRKTADET